MSKQVRAWIGFRNAVALILLFALPAHAGHLSGVMPPRGASDPTICDTLVAVDLGLPRMAHARITRGATAVWEDSVATVTGATWDLYFPDLAPGEYQVLHWASNAFGSGCPHMQTHIVLAPEPRYKIIFGWTTVGAVYDNSQGKVIGAAEMLRRLNACEAGRVEP